MKVHGLEGALVSHKPGVILSLTPADPRAYTIEIASPAALLVAKAHKMADRAGETDVPRLNNKDAFDIYRILICH